MFGFGMQELLLLFLIALLLFGAKRLPDMGRSLGNAIKEFKKGFHETGSDASSPADPGKQ